jgi:hypothetical protein
VLVLFFNDLKAKLPFREVAALDRFPKVAAIEIGVLARDLLCFIPYE